VGLAPGPLLVDGFWRGALVTRWPVLRVDGGKCYLLSPVPSVMATGASDHEVAGYTMKASEVAVARLLQQLAGHGGLAFDF
jgi:hypothetical protein